MNTSVVFITHDLGVVSELCAIPLSLCTTAVWWRKRRHRRFLKPLHPYTQGLLNAIPRITKERKPLSTIEGMVPNPVERMRAAVSGRDAQKA